MVLRISNSTLTNGPTHAIRNAELDIVWQGINMVISVSIVPYSHCYARILTDIIAKLELPQAPRTSYRNDIVRTRGAPRLYHSTRDLATSEV
jgi:hypothetical protein